MSLYQRLALQHVNDRHTTLETIGHICFIYVYLYSFVNKIYKILTFYQYFNYSVAYKDYLHFFNPQKYIPPKRGV